MQDDLIVMVEGTLMHGQGAFVLTVGPGTDGTYYFQAGSVSLPGELLLSRSAWSATTLTGLLPGFWRMQDKLGMPLDEIHISGHVPQCE